MTFEEILHQTVDMLQRRERVSYQALKRQFEIDDEYLETLKFELIKVLQVAVEEEGIMLSWIGDRNSKFSKSNSNPVSLSGRQSELQKEIAERRQLTVMFIDLVGSTVLSQIIDPEDLREILFNYQVLCDSVVNAHGGKVVQHSGDGIVVYFGYPHAHEDDPQRAVLSGLSIIADLKDLNKDLIKNKNIILQVRIGIHTGLVVVGATGGSAHSEMTATGEVPNLAARIQNAAKPNSILISETTNKLVSRYFETSIKGAYNLKGFDEPIELFLVVGEKEKNQVELLSPAGSTRLIGREWEKARIMERWEFTCQSNGQAVLISGEAGIGKSRLIHALKQEISDDSMSLLTFRCSPFHSNTAFQPIIERLQYEIVLDREEKHEINLDKLEKYLKTQGLTEPEDLALCAALLSIPLLSGSKELKFSAERQKMLTINCLVRWLMRNHAPSLILFEDLHWADQSTLEVLGQVIRQISSSSVLFIATYRPVFQPTWENGSNIIQIILNRLTRNQAAAMIHEISSSLPKEVVNDLLDKTDGNPLFIEEVTKLILESGSLEKEQGVYHLKGTLKELSIPKTIQGLLMARLDQLETAKEVAQIGATIGREFSYSLIKAISLMKEDVLENHLSKLVNSQLLFCKGEIPNAIYTFKHALVQEAAHSSLLKKRRQEFHRRIVENLEQSYPMEVQSNPELLAYHCSKAGLMEKAVIYWRRAGELAISQSAHAEAINHLNEGLLVLKELPDSQKRVNEEILFQIALGVPLTALRGYGSIEVEQAYARARNLCQEAGETVQLIPALYGLWRYYLLRAEYREARALSDQILNLSNNSSDPVHLVVSNRASGSTAYYLGELENAKKHLEEVINSKTSPERRAGTLLYDVVDAWVTARSYASLTYWLQGFPEKAIEASNEAISMAESLEHPFSQALAQCFASWLYQFRGESKKALACAQQGLKIAEDNGFSFWIGWANILEGWAKNEEEIGSQHTLISDGLETWHATGSELGTSYFLFLQGESLLNYGDLLSAWQCLEKAKQFVEKTGEKWWEAELFRLKGLLHLATENSKNDKAEECFRQALKIASDQKARSLELRAATSLAELLSNTSRKSEGIKILNEVLDWFKGGPDSKDLQEAKEILKKISTNKGI